MKNNLENQDIKTDKPLAMSYEALKADRDAQQKRADALAVENGQLREMNSSLCAELQEYESDNDDFGPAPQSVVNCFALLTPNTDTAIAAIEARGLEKFAEATITIGEQEKEESIIYAGKQAMLFAKQLREAK